MDQGLRAALFALAMTATAATLSQLSAQSATSAPTPACGVLSVAEVRKITGYPAYLDYVDGDPPGEGAGGGSSCQFSGPVFGTDKAPLVSLVLIPGKDYTTGRRALKLPEGCTLEDAKGLGDDAFFQNCPDPRSKRSSPLFVKVGANDLILQMDIEPPATAAKVRETVLELARAAVAKMRS
jgi:hypothetical protein